MAIELSKQERIEAAASLRRYFREELEEELGEMRAGFLLDYILKEIAPLAYNKGVEDASAFIRARLEDLSGSCFEPAMSYWQQKRR